MPLWLMRISAKLNVVLGMPNLGGEFIPTHLRYLVSLMARQPMNPLMPLPLAGGTIGAALLWQAAWAAATPAQAAGLAILATMLALAAVEHWFLILPLPFARLWGWLRHFRPGTPSVTRDRRETRHGLPALLP